MDNWETDREECDFNTNKHSGSPSSVIFMVVIASTIKFQCCFSISIDMEMSAMNAVSQTIYDAPAEEWKTCPTQPQTESILYAPDRKSKCLRGLYDLCSVWYPLSLELRFK